MSLINCVLALTLSLSLSQFSAICFLLVFRYTTRYDHSLSQPAGALSFYGVGIRRAKRPR